MRALPTCDRCHSDTREMIYDTAPPDWLVGQNRKGYFCGAISQGQIAVEHSFPNGRLRHGLGLPALQVKAFSDALLQIDEARPPGCRLVSLVSSKVAPRLRRSVPLASPAAQTLPSDTGSSRQTAHGWCHGAWVAGACRTSSRGGGLRFPGAPVLSLAPATQGPRYRRVAEGEKIGRIQSEKFTKLVVDAFYCCPQLLVFFKQIGARCIRHRRSSVPRSVSGCRVN